MKCPTCGRRPSERLGLGNAHRPGWNCPDPIHDLADEAPALKARVEELEGVCNKDVWGGWYHVPSRGDPGISWKERAEGLSKRPAILAMTEEWKAMEAERDEARAEVEEAVALLRRYCAWDADEESTVVGDTLAFLAKHALSPSTERGPA